MTDWAADFISRSDIDQLAKSENLTLDDERISILESMSSIDVQACPGSGKTTLVGAKLILLAKKWPFGSRGICVLSHTNVAKNEIIDCLKRSKTLEASKLLAYPHFIGTIQEFTDRYLAIPFLRSARCEVVSLDPDTYLTAALRLLSQNSFSWLSGTLNGLGGADKKAGFLAALHYVVKDGALKPNIISTPRAWTSQANRERAVRDLSRLKTQLAQFGCFLFQDMYAFAARALVKNTSLSVHLSQRFPIVILDEMQDTQEFQDQLVRSCFSNSSKSTILQRFGDPDQAIFNGSGQEKPNESFNSKVANQINFVVRKSHRFDDDIAEKAGRFSFNAVLPKSELTDEKRTERASCRADSKAFTHTIYFFDEDRCTDVIGEFGRLVAAQFSDSYRKSDDFTVKVVGGVGKPIDPDKPVQLKIAHYWPSYEKGKSRGAASANMLIETIRPANKKLATDIAETYRFLMSGILLLLRKSDVRDVDGKHFTATSLRTHLSQKTVWDGFRTLIHGVLTVEIMDENVWQKFTDELVRLLDITSLNEEVTNFLRFSDVEDETPPSDDIQLPDLVGGPENTIRFREEFDLQLSTIHAVKGETHDATLVLETRNHCFDFETMLPYFLGELPNQEHPNASLRKKPSSQAAFKPNQVFMRQFYVAMSRSRHLLCLAMRSSNVDAAQMDLLRKNGWNVIHLQSTVQSLETGT